MGIGLQCSITISDLVFLSDFACDCVINQCNLWLTYSTEYNRTSTVQFLVSVLDILQTLAIDVILDFVLQGLKYLDLSGVYVRDLNINSDKHKLPKSLVTLKLRDSLISLQDYSVISLIGQHKDLLELDIGLHNICIEYLQELSTGLENLKTLNMAGLYLL